MHKNEKKYENMYKNEKYMKIYMHKNEKYMSKNQ